MAAVVVAAAVAAPPPNPPAPDPDPDPPPTARIPSPSTEFSVLKRTSFGVSKSSLAAIESIGVLPYLAQQLDYENIDATLIEDRGGRGVPARRQRPARR